MSIKINGWSIPISFIFNGSISHLSATCVLPVCYLCYLSATCVLPVTCELPACLPVCYLCVTCVLPACLPVCYLCVTCVTTWLCVNIRGPIFYNYIQSLLLMLMEFKYPWLAPCFSLYKVLVSVHCELIMSDYMVFDKQSVK